MSGSLGWYNSMKVGDVVRHVPEKSDHALLYEIEGIGPDFKAGLIIEIQNAACKVIAIGSRAMWYQHDELELIQRAE